MPSEHEAEGSGRRILILIAALCIGFAGVWSYILLNTKPPVAAGVMTGLVGVPIHTELRQGGTRDQGIGGGLQMTDQVLVLANATVRDTAKIPLFPFEQTGTLTLANGEQQSVHALSTVDMMRAFRAYPQLAAAHVTLAGTAATPSLHRENTLKPGEAEHGLVLFSYPITKDVWETRRSFEMAISFRWQKDLILAQPQQP